MVDQEPYDRYREDSRALAAIGRFVDAQVGKVTVRLPRAVAQAAVDAWERDDSAEVDEVDEETPEQYVLRDHAAELALIGIAISERGRWEGEELVIDLDLASAGAAVRASE